MSTFILLTITGLGLGAMYFLIASGLSLIYGLMGVLNFAHGAFLTVGAYATWWTSTHVGGGPGTKLLVGAIAGLAVGAVLAALVELVLIR
ncbi:MAG: branched-chain amino acid ABC transporter permease, partial [Actinobacteria bacterium]|nr:branched-chain amino acid ABC transporter permease [Actinomycetota bacterium]